jgi:MscS family membrane protein
MRTGFIMTVAFSLLLVCTSAEHAMAEDAPSEVTPPTEAAPADDLDPGVPRSAMRGYLVAAREGDYERAAQSLDLRLIPERQRAEQGPVLARHLHEVLDLKLWVDLETLSDDPQGRQDDGQPRSRDVVGRIETDEGFVDILLQRVRREDGAQVWKISSSTVARIPDLYEEFGYGPLSEFLPAPFFEVRLLEVQLWQWIGLLVLIVVAYLLSWIAGALLLRLSRPFIERSETQFDDQLVAGMLGPLRLVVFVILFGPAASLLGLSVPVRETLRDAQQAGLLAAVAWFLVRLIDILANVVSQRLTTRGAAPATQFVPLGRKAVKALLVVFAVLGILDIFGFNVTALVAGLGIGGLAVALAAQKTIENLFGGVTLLADRPIVVGDFCRFGDKIGTVEEIGLRSTRIRTLDRTVVTVPNSQFSDLQLENFAKRDVIRLHTMLGLRYETTPDQLRCVLAELRSMLLAHPKVSPDPARVRFVGFGDYSLDLELFAYLYTADWNEFLSIREDIFLRIMDVVEGAGSGFAFPSQTAYLGRDDGLDPEKTRAAEERVEAWRSEKRLPFPDFDSNEKLRIKDTLAFPPEGSALGGAV